MLFNMSTVRLDRVSFLYSVKCTAVTDLQPFQPIKKIHGGTFALLYSRFYSFFQHFKPYADIPVWFTCLYLPVVIA